MILAASYNSINNNLSIVVVNGIVMLGYYGRHHHCRHCYSRGGSIVVVVVIVVVECNDHGLTTGVSFCHWICWISNSNFANRISAKKQYYRIHLFNLSNPAKKAN